jgi:hypothetical protein
VSISTIRERPMLWGLSHAGILLCGAAGIAIGRAASTLEGAWAADIGASDLIPETGWGGAGPTTFCTAITARAKVSNVAAA